MRVFLTGATGTLGRPTTRALVAAGHQVRGVARGPAKADVVRADGGEPVEVSLFDPRALSTAMQGCDAVMHFATKIPPVGRITRRNFAENERLRRDASRCLVDAALGTGAIGVYVQESIAFSTPMPATHGFGKMHRCTRAGSTTPCSPPSTRPCASRRRAAEV